MTLTPDARTRQPTAAERILDTAEALVQVRGYNGFSYADVAAELNVTKASLHYHFSGKAQLGEALILRYTARFAAELDRINALGPDVATKLDAYITLFADVLASDRMCLCGMLAAEYETLAPQLQAGAVRFFDHNEAWLASLLETAERAGAIRLDGPAIDAARVIVSGLEGAMLVTRPYRDVQRFRGVANSIVAGVLGLDRSPR